MLMPPFCKKCTPEVLATAQGPSGMVQQVKVRQQVHGEIAAKRSVAMAAITTDSGNLDRALIEENIVALMSLGC